MTRLHLLFDAEVESWWTEFGWWFEAETSAGTVVAEGSASESSSVRAGSGRTGLAKTLGTCNVTVARTQRCCKCEAESVLAKHLCFDALIHA